MSKLDDIVTACECCEGITALTPASLDNRPGLSSLAYRVGNHAHFKATMLARLSTLPALAGLTTRQNDDQAIALLDAWATVADVLSFYQERLANEGFLRTATERRSLLELARTIGYELRPGVAASTYLAFTVDDTSESPQEFIIPAGTRAQSIPGSEELPQTFETSEELIARPEWNEMKPRATVPQFFNIETRTFYFKGTDTNLKPGDWMLLLARDSWEPDAGGEINKKSLQVVRAEIDDINDRTRVELDENPPALPSYQFTTLTYGAFSLAKQSMTGANVSSILTGATWSSADLAAFTAVQQWPLNQLFNHINTVSKAPKPPKDIGVFAMRARTAPFGHNAPRWDTIPADWRTGTDPPYPSPGWEDVNITTKSDGTSTYGDGVIYLENTFPEIQANSWVVLKSATQEAKVYQVKKTHEKSLADFGLSAKTSGLTLEPSTGLTSYKVRETTIFANSEELELVDLPNTAKVEGDTLELDSMIDLAVGQTAILTGERADLEGVIESEVVTLAGVFHNGHFTQLTFARPLKHPYKRETVTLNANVAPATHGETRQQILGSGDASLTMQRFTLRQVPLTYVSAPVPSGGLSTLELRVNGVLWHEAADLYRIGPEDRSYILRHHDDGRASILFGDGARGMRLPTGVENITATYRAGIGTDGLVNVGQVSLLLTQPLGVRNVTNPLAPTGAEDPETRDQARENAPLTVLTLDRIVSLQDFEDFARAFSGIGKASATWLWDGESRIVHVTIAAADGEPVDPQSALYQNLFEAMNRARDPFQPLRLDSFEKLLFNLDAAVRVHPNYVPEDVLTEIENELRHTFSFRPRSFGQSIALSEIMAVMQQVKAVQGVDVNAFYFSHDTTVNPSLQTHLIATPATLVKEVVKVRKKKVRKKVKKTEIEITEVRIQPAQLLTITPAPITLNVML